MVIGYRLVAANVYRRSQSDNVTVVKSRTAHPEDSLNFRDYIENAYFDRRPFPIERISMTCICLCKIGLAGARYQILGRTSAC